MGLEKRVERRCMGETKDRGGCGGGGGTFQGRPTLPFVGIGKFGGDDECVCAKYLGFVFFCLFVCISDCLSVGLSVCLK